MTLHPNLKRGIFPNLGRIGTINPSFQLCLVATISCPIETLPNLANPSRMFGRAPTQPSFTITGGET